MATTIDAVKIIRKKFYDGNPERTAELEKEIERLRRVQDRLERIDNDVVSSMLNRVESSPRIVYRTAKTLCDE